MAEPLFSAVELFGMSCGTYIITRLTSLDLAGTCQQSLTK